MASPVYVVIGGSRGIGLEYIKQLAARVPSTIVFAGVRTPSTSTELNQLASSNPNIHVFAIDLTNDNSVAAAATSVGATADGVDVLIVSGAVWAGGSLSQNETSTLSKLLDTNVLGPFRAINAFLPLLRKRQTRKIINISSTIGSNTLSEPYAVVANTSGPYNVSKGALNSLTRSYATELKDEGFTIIALCPGGVSTDMAAQATQNPIVAAAFAGKYITPTVSVEKQLQVIDSITKEKNGSFLSHENQVIPW